jgi:hypothetical protein
VQSWFARAFPGRSPYRLFALSNLASMLALLGYPFLLEPWEPTRAQAWGWSIAYALFVVLCSATALRHGTRALPAPAPAGDAPFDAAPTTGLQLLWGLLAATGSILLLAISAHVTQNIAAVPLLWLAPLAIYLLTFVLCFEGTGWYRRDVFLAVTAASLGVMAWTLADPGRTHDLALQLGVFLVGLFIACMFCHGELATLKPSPRWLTRFYLMVSLGGAVGAALVGIVAPLVLPAHFELAIGLSLCAALLLGRSLRAPLVHAALSLVALLVAIGCGIWSARNFYDDTIETARNFYGVLRVQESGANEVSRHRSLVHDTIKHGNEEHATD